MNKVIIDVNEKLNQKADMKEIERFVPQKVDETYRTLLHQLSSLHKDLGRTVTKDEFHQHLSAKVFYFTS